MAFEEGNPGEEIEILESGTKVEIVFEKNAPTVSVGKVSVIACGGISKSMNLLFNEHFFTIGERLH